MIEAEPFVNPPLRTKTIAICGFGSETLNEAPFEDENCEVWILNMLHGLVPRWDRLFELHDRATVEQESDAKEELRKVERGGLRHIDYLRSVSGKPIYTTERWTDVPCSVRFPVERVMTALGVRCPKLSAQPYFVSTFAFMLAYAVILLVDNRRDPCVPEDGEAIHVCGVEMMSGEEYQYQRSNAEFMCGWVLGHGITLHVPQRSALLESDGIYAYSQTDATLTVLSRLRSWAEDQKRIQATRVEEAAARRQQAMADFNTYDGAAQMAAKIAQQLAYICRGGKI